MILLLEKQTFWNALAEPCWQYRKSIREDSNSMDCYCVELNSSINVAEVERLVSKEQADRLRARYF